MREIVLDTETTGFKSGNGDRIVEIACLEIFNGVATGRTFHTYLNPERSVPKEAVAIHGLTDDFLKDKPLFRDVFNAFSAFIGDAKLVIHNAPFDIGFLNAEIARLKTPLLDPARTVDTKKIAAKLYPGETVTLDSLCDRFNIDRTSRTLHGALLDCQLLSAVYGHLKNGLTP